MLFCALQCCFAKILSTGALLKAELEFNSGLVFWRLGSLECVWEDKLVVSPDIVSFEGDRSPIGGRESKGVLSLPFLNCKTFLTPALYLASSSYLTVEHWALVQL